MSDPAFDELLRRLVLADVQFVLIGGFALNAWGVVRGTKDIDVVVDPSPENFERIAKLASELGGHIQVSDAFIGSEPSIAAFLKQGERTLIATDIGALDVVQGLTGVPSYSELKSEAVDVEILGVQVAVCSLDDLRVMKRAAGRTRDLADLEDLDIAHDDKKETGNNRA